MHTLQVFFYMATIPYTKPAKSYIDQLSHLKQMGLVVKNDKRALRYLETVGYYRLRGYMVPFFESPAIHKFKKNTTIDNVLDLYKFDRELRILVFSAIETIVLPKRSSFISIDTPS